MIALASSALAALGEQAEVVDAGRRRGRGAASGRAWGWEWRPIDDRDAAAHGPALETDLHGRQVEGVEDDLDAASRPARRRPQRRCRARRSVAVLVTMRVSDHKNASCSALRGSGARRGPAARAGRWAPRRSL